MLIEYRIVFGCRGAIITQRIDRCSSNPSNIPSTTQGDFAVSKSLPSSYAECLIGKGGGGSSPVGPGGNIYTVGSKGNGCPGNIGAGGFAGMDDVGPGGGGGMDDIGPGGGGLEDIGPGGGGLEDIGPGGGIGCHKRPVLIFGPTVVWL